MTGVLQPILCRSLGLDKQINLPAYVVRLDIDNLVDCNQFVGYLAVYRVNMAVAAFFLLFCLIMICVWSSKDPRSYLQNGFWFFKWLFVFGLIIAFFFIPDGSNFYFSRGKVLFYYLLLFLFRKKTLVSLGLGLTASILFIVIQIVILVDFAHTWAESW